MRNRKKSGLVLLAVIFLAAIGVKGYCYQAVRSPHYTLQQIQESMAEKDQKKFEHYLDVEQFFQQGYDDGSEQLAKHVKELHERYPKDYFFWHEPDFMRSYTEEHRAAALPFVHSVLNDYFASRTQAESFEANPGVWLAGQMEKFRTEGSFEIKSIHEQGNKAVVSLILHGTDTGYGRLLENIPLELELERQPDEHWRIERILNVEELTFPVAESAENFWTLQGWQ